MKTEIRVESIEKFVATSAEVQKLIGKTPAAGFTPRLCEKRVKGSSVYYFVGQNNKRSTTFSHARSFSNGFAFVEKDNLSFYIDTDFDPVLSGNKVRTSENLVGLIESNPGSVRKYVSPRKILAMQNETTLQVLCSPRTTSPELTHRFEVFEKFARDEASF